MKWRLSVRLFVHDWPDRNPNIAFAVRCWRRYFGVVVIVVVVVSYGSGGGRGGFRAELGVAVLLDLHPCRCTQQHATSRGSAGWGATCHGKTRRPHPCKDVTHYEEYAVGACRP